MLSVIQVEPTPDQNPDASVSLGGCFYPEPTGGHYKSINKEVGHVCLHSFLQMHMSRDVGHKALPPA